MGSNHLGSGGGYVPREGLPTIKVGDQLNINHVQNIVKGIDRATVVYGNGYQVRRYSNSTVIQPNNYVVGAGFKNFQVFTYTSDTKQCYCTVSVGTVNRVIPKIDTLYIDNVDSNTGLVPRIEVSQDGYIVLESVYENNKPFPKVAYVKFYPSAGLQPLDNQNASKYILASVKYNPATQENGNIPFLNVTQFHTGGNVAVSRIKISSQDPIWHWWVV